MRSAKSSREDKSSAEEVAAGGVVTSRSQNDRVNPANRLAAVVFSSDRPDLVQSVSLADSLFYRRSHAAGDSCQLCRSNSLSRTNNGTISHILRIRNSASGHISQTSSEVVVVKVFNWLPLVLMTWLQSGSVLQSADSSVPDTTTEVAAPSFQIGSLTFIQIEHHDSVTGPNDHFGCLLTDTTGKVVIDEQSRTYLYTGSQLPGSPVHSGWVSHVREWNWKSGKPGTRSQILDVQPTDQWATVHLAVQVNEKAIVLFFSTGKRIRSAVSVSPTGPFQVDPDFQIVATDPWEEGRSLESDIGLVPIHNNPDEFRFWKLYDMLGNTQGNGWAEVSFNKQTRRVTLVGKHPGNPMSLRLPGRVTARTGGTSDSSFRVDDRYLMLYLSKPDDKTYRMSAALSPDPLFQSIEQNIELDGPRGGETIIEKFQWAVWNEDLFIFYDIAHRDGDWRTAPRRYRIRRPQ